MSLILRTVEIPDTQGLEFQVIIGTNSSSNRVILVRMRKTDSRTGAYNPVIEMDVDLSSLYRDTVTGFIRDPEPKPTPG